MDTNGNSKELLIRDLCARLPYGVIIYLKYDENTYVTREMGLGSLHDIMFDSAEGKPYLRPMSSMTEEEKEEYEGTFDSVYDVNDYGEDADSWHEEFSIHSLDWLNRHHFDFRNLIDKNLAIAVTEENNPYKK